MLIQADASDCKWLVSDHLGSPRIILGKSGSLADTRRRNFLPFGEDLGAGQFGRTQALGYEPSGTPSNPREKFATYERDDETGLDFAQARYYQSKLGRFTTPDEFTGGPTELFAEVAAHNPTFYAELAEPQSLNKYQYCLNNPLKFVDPDGHQAEMADTLKSGAAQNATREVGRALIGTGARLETVPGGQAIGLGLLLSGALLYRAATAPEEVAPTPQIAGLDPSSYYAAQAFNYYANNNQSQTQPPPGASGQQSGQASGGAMPPDDKKGGSEGRDARKINQKRLDAAKQNVASLRAQRDILRAVPNKTPEQILELKRLDRALNRELDRQRKSETHGRKGKGS